MSYLNYFVAFCNVYNTKKIEQDATASDRNNEKLFPKSEPKLPVTKFNSIMPPPNVTGNLHLGHAMMITVLDVICRWKHLKGYDVELVPGLDHAGIATQVVVEQQLKKKYGQSRFDIGKRAFVDKVFKWKDEKGTTLFIEIFEQIQNIVRFFLCRQWHQRRYSKNGHDFQLGKRILHYG